MSSVSQEPDQYQPVYTYVTQDAPSSTVIQSQIPQFYYAQSDATPVYLQTPVSILVKTGMSIQTRSLTHREFNTNQQSSIHQSFPGHLNQSQSSMMSTSSGNTQVIYQDARQSGPVTGFHSPDPNISHLQQMSSKPAARGIHQYLRLSKPLKVFALSSFT